MYIGNTWSNLWAFCGSPRWSCNSARSVVAEMSRDKGKDYLRLGRTEVQTFPLLRYTVECTVMLLWNFLLFYELRLANIIGLFFVKSAACRHTFWSIDQWKLWPNGRWIRVENITPVDTGQFPRVILLACTLHPTGNRDRVGFLQMSLCVRPGLMQLWSSCCDESE